MSDAQRKAIEAAIKGMPSSGSTPGIKEGGIIVHAATQQLESLGFLADDIQQAVNALPSDTEFSTSALLDWLCIHLPEQHLPASFTPGQLPSPSSSLTYFGISICRVQMGKA